MNTKDIALLANVSRSTVSRVLNNYSNVSEEAKIKVEEVIKKHGYTPNHFARSLAGKTSNIVGVYFADIDETGSSKKWIGINSPYNMEFLANIVNELKEKGYVALVNVINSLNEIKDVDFYFKNRILHGGIFIGFPYKTKKLEKLAKEYNIVLIDQYSSDDDEKKEMKLVNSDNFNGGYQATKLLIDKGHKKILHIAGDKRLSAIEREKGYIQAMEDNSIEKKEIIYGKYREDVAYREMKKFLKKEVPTGIFVANDIMSLGVIKALNEKNLKIPEDVSIIGFDNLKLSQWGSVNLTTVEVSLEEIAKNTVGLLLKKDKKHLVCGAHIEEKDTVREIKN